MLTTIEQKVARSDTIIPSFVDLFCGCGGFSLGFKQAGFTHLGAIDIDLNACKTYRANISANVINDDLTGVYSLAFSSSIGTRPDVVLASPPCEGFSEANPGRAKRHYDRLYNPPGSLTIEAISWISDLDPKIGFIMENVPAISINPLRSYIESEFARIGYGKVFFNMIPADLLGSASRRPRTFISNIDFEQFLPVVPVIEGNTSWRVLSDLPDPSDVHDIPNHEMISSSNKRASAFRTLHWNDSLIKFDAAGGKRKKSWYRINPYYPAPIIMGKSIFVHPYEDRQLTIREIARLQGYLDDFIFYGNNEQMRNQIGESVSPVVSRFLAGIVMDLVGDRTGVGRGKRK
ncbi:MAG: DNA cytosine methyltransferase [Promethearchaeota archaeon]